MPAVSLIVLRLEIEDDCLLPKSLNYVAGKVFMFLQLPNIALEEVISAKKAQNES